MFKSRRLQSLTGNGMSIEAMFIVGHCTWAWAYLKKPRNVWLTSHNKGRGTFALWLKWKSRPLSNNNIYYCTNIARRVFVWYGNNQNFLVFYAVFICSGYNNKAGLHLNKQADGGTFLSSLQFTCACLDGYKACRGRWQDDACMVHNMHTYNICICTMMGTWWIISILRLLTAVAKWPSQQSKVKLLTVNQT